MKIEINVGNLTSISSLYSSAGPMLANANLQFRRGLNPDIEWDLTSVEPGRQNIGAVCAFLCLSKLARDFTGRPSHVKFDKNPNILDFWYNSNFYATTKHFDLLLWDDSDIGYVPIHGKKYSAKIFHLPLVAPPETEKEIDIYAWKDERRMAYTRDFKLRAGGLLNQSIKDDYKRDAISTCVAEIISNALIHGRSGPFVGMQKTSRRLTFSVCDTGLGFLNSFNKRNCNRPFAREANDLDALLTGSLFDRREVGLFTTIQFVTSEGGIVNMSSANGELQWSEENWQEVVSRGEFGKRDGTHTMLDAKETLPATEYTHGQRPHGFHKLWQAPLRGSRIIFEIPIRA